MHTSASASLFLVFVETKRERKKNAVQVATKARFRICLLFFVRLLSNPRTKIVYSSHKVDAGLLMLSRVP